MKNITRKELRTIAKKYNRDEADLRDWIDDWESEGEYIDAIELEDRIINGDCE